MSFLSQPKGYYQMFTALLLERFCFWGFKSILFVFLLNVAAFSQEETNSYLGIFSEAVPFLPLVGGLLIDTALRDRKPMVLACRLMLLGSIIVAIAGFTTTKPFVYLGGLLFLLGGSLFRPGFYSKLIQIYPDKNAASVDAGFVFITMAANIGGLFAPIVCGVLYKMVAPGFGFLFAGLAMVPALMLLNQVSDADQSQPELPRNWSQIHTTIAFILIAAVFPLQCIFKSKDIWLASLPDADSIGNTLQFMDLAVGVLASILIPLIWMGLAKKGKPLYTVPKLLVGLIAALIGTVLIYLSASVAPEAGKPAMSIVLTAVAIFAVVDMFVSPVMLAYVSKLVPPERRATYIGGWMTLTTIISMVVPLGAGKGVIPVIVSGIAVVLLLVLTKPIQESAVGVL